MIPADNPMTLEQLENSLPNGFHDAEIESIAVDYVSKRAVIKMRLHTGDPGAANEDEREAYKQADLLLSELFYFVIDPPDPTSEFKEKGSVCVSAGTPEEGAPSPPRCGGVPAGRRVCALVFCHRLELFHSRCGY